MKNVSLKATYLVAALIVCLHQTSLAQDYYDYYLSKKRLYTISNDKIMVKFKNNATDIQKNQMLNSQVFDKNENINSDIFLINFRKKNDKIGIEEIIKEYRKNDNIEYISPILLNEYGKEVCALTDYIVVKLKKGTPLSDLERLAKENDCKISKKTHSDEGIYFLSISNNSDKNALQVSNLFYETHLFEWSQPDYLLFINYSFTPNDALYNQQWGLSKIASANAWDISRGSSFIKIAVVDSGVDITHPDLQANLLFGYDATGNNSNGAATPGYNQAAHGTWVAGIVGALGNNSIGIAGVAHNCKILPIRVGLGGAVLSSSEAANGISWAWQNGADVINLSWVAQADNVITNAINNATTLGRYGKGCIVIASSGNQELMNPARLVSYPANLPNVIAVGASLQDDSWGNSNYNDASFDLVAPGSLNFTTDLRSQSLVDYSERNGSSIAAPHVSGVAALILSVNPSLTRLQVEEILETTADKVRTDIYTYGTSLPNGSWNEKMGHGRLNAYKAVLKARDCYSSTPFGISIAPGDLLCNNEPFTISYSGSVPYYNIAQFEWKINGQLQAENSPSITFNNNPCYACVNGYNSVSLRIKVAGCDNWHALTATADFDRVSCNGYFLVYPNPTKDDLTVSFNETPTKDSDLPLEIILYNHLQQPLRTAKPREMFKNKTLKDDKKVVFNVRDLPRGTYYLHLVGEKNTEKRQILIEK